MAAGAYPAWSYKLRQVWLASAVMGARPEYFPIILAIASSGIGVTFQFDEFVRFRDGGINWADSRTT